MANLGDPAVYFAITPSPVASSWHIRRIRSYTVTHLHQGVNFGNETITYYMKFGDTTHGVNYNNTVDALYRRYSTENPTYSMALSPQAWPVQPGAPHVGTVLENLLLGHKPFSTNGGVVSEWHQVAWTNRAAGTIEQFAGELMRLQRKFKGQATPADQNHPNHVLNFDVDFARILQLWSP
ncbi:hypothetical protein B0H19DRAFT_1071382 [Mycena capillaripes]|nr:hypothetical protein B0H19DRAFT_1071382 [Mycena capillaripes]